VASVHARKAAVWIAVSAIAIAAAAASVSANGHVVASPYAPSGSDPFIEDDFLGGQRLDPATDGRPDARPFVSEDLPTLGDLRSDFHFHRAPRPPVLLRPYPQPRDDAWKPARRH
jgi:hypothetical protein